MIRTLYVPTFTLLFALIVTKHSIAADSSRELPSGVMVIENEAFSTDVPELTLDIYLPKERQEPVPCIVVIQGGGFRPQTGKKFAPFASYLAENGYAAALIGYRGSPEYRYLDTIADAKASVRHVRRISAKYNIDPQRIGAMGRSAGGTLAAFLAITGGMKAFEGKSVAPEYSSDIQAAVCFAGVYDLVSRFTDEEQIALQPGVKAKIESNTEWIGPPFSPTDDAWVNASVINHVDAADPPMLLLHCKDDSVVPWLQSQQLYEKLEKLGVPCEIEYYETGGHGFSKETGDVSKKRMLTFFDQVLKKMP